jgi:hypothetical protein
MSTTERKKSSIRGHRVILLGDWPKFHRVIGEKFPSLTTEQLRDLWEFGNDCWRNGYNYAKSTAGE